MSLRKVERARRGAKKRRASLLAPALVLGVAAAVLIAMVFIPSPDEGNLSGIQLFGEDPEAEIYGPEMPNSTVGAYPSPVVEPVVLPESTGSGEEVVYVYASDDQECYHLPTCKFAFASGNRFTVPEALLLGYKPCGRCNPPTE